VQKEGRKMANNMEVENEEIDTKWKTYCMLRSGNNSIAELNNKTNKQTCAHR
jgi:hypothetical protein